ncbi:hypothetical protein, partial [Staphylococcus epidermidis]|uniref:hypothetical protein n=1 Tax=Staphylococcus epidermidis TaxID=1282 RepID=UPI002738ECD3
IGVAALSIFHYGDDNVTRFDFGPGVAYDFLPERLRFSLRAYLSNFDYKAYDDVAVLGAQAKVQYFVPIHDPWRIFVGLGFALEQRAPLRRDLTPDKDRKSSCVFACSSSSVEQAGHVYEHLTIPGSREFSSQFGVSYS